MVSAPIEGKWQVLRVNRLHRWEHSPGDCTTAGRWEGLGVPPGSRTDGVGEAGGRWERMYSNEGPAGSGLPEHLEVKVSKEHYQTR